LLPQIANATEAGIILKIILPEELGFPPPLSAGNPLFPAGNDLITGAIDLRGRVAAGRSNHRAGEGGRIGFLVEIILPPNSTDQAKNFRQE